jgi:hypothetical protein
MYEVRQFLSSGGPATVLKSSKNPVTPICALNSSTRLESLVKVIEVDGNETWPVAFTACT